MDLPSHGLGDEAHRVRGRWFKNCSVATGFATLLAASARSSPPDDRPNTPTVPEGGASDFDAADPNRGFVSYARAAANVFFVNWLIWQIAWSRDKDWAPITRDTLARNVGDGFTFDQDVLRTNFFGHPYHGALQFNAARGAGLAFWESSLYAFGGSTFWEVFAERERPSVNDLAVTALGGMILGEITHRLSSQVLDESHGGRSRLFRELAAAAIDPMRAFDRWVTGRAYRRGAPALRTPLRLQLELGADAVVVQQQNDPVESPRPALLVALDLEYGSLGARPNERALDPFEFFQLHAGANLFEKRQHGIHAYAYGLLYGRDFVISAWRGSSRVNDVLGVAMNYEYVGLNVTTYSAVSVGPVNHLVVRARARQLRVSAGVDFVPILGATTREAGGKGRDYNFATGFSGWSGIELRLSRFGELGMRMRYYVASVVDGERGVELVGSTRLWYESPDFHGLGLGISPTLMYRRGAYDATEDYSAKQTSTRAYVFFQP